MAYITNQDLPNGGTLIGTDESDTFDATFPGFPFVSTWLIGGGGNDTYFVDAIDDRIVEEAGGGTDTVRSSASYILGAFVENLILLGTAGFGADGNDLANVITGNDAGNRIDGRGGNDTMAGGLGGDVYIVDSTLDVVIEAANAGDDEVEAHANYTLGANLERLTMYGSLALTGTGNVLDNLMTGNTSNNIISGMGGNDTLIGMDGDDTLNGGDGNDIFGDRFFSQDAGSDRYIGGAGDDLFFVDQFDKPVEENAGGGNDTVYANNSYTLGNNIENLTLAGGTPALNGTGNPLNNRIQGNELANSLVGLAGNDTLDGQGGIDTMIGGTGNDLYYVDDTLDKVIEKAGEGIDKVIVSTFYTLPDNVENLLMTGDGYITAYGNSLNNTMTGNASGNFLLGFDGNDVLDGGGGVDNLQGGMGDDTYYFDNINDYAMEFKNAGTDTVFTSVGYNFFGSPYLENFVLTGTADGDLIGNRQANLITGNAGANLIDGRDGIDTMTGGLGDDTYVVETFDPTNAALGDKVIEGVNGGTDTVISYVNYTLAANAENLILANTSLAGSIAGTGNALNNDIRGNNGINNLDGGAGNDQLYGYGSHDILKGGAGNDLLDGGTGIDTLQGGLGDDIYFVDDENEQGLATEALNAGTDMVRSSVDWLLFDNFENLVLLGSGNLSGTGNALNNSILGNSGNNILVGGAGNDTLDGGLGEDIMSGGIGNDTYVIDNDDDTIDENPGGGIDTLQISISRGTFDFDTMSHDFHDLEDDVENLTMTGIGDIQARGNSLANIITGNDGDNVLDGAGGADKLIGGKGDDVYFLYSAADAVTELANQGLDTVFVSYAPAGGTYTLGATLEVLRFSLNPGVVNGTGNALDNGLEGNNKANRLDGGAGNDFIHGGGGGDTLIGGAGNDMIEANGGNSVAGTRATMTGGLGDDWYVVGSLDGLTHKGERDANIVELAGQGTDTLQTAVDFDMSDPLTGAANIENLYLDDGNYHELDPGYVEDNWDIHASGNALNNKIFGNLGANTVQGGGGDDTFYFHTYSVDYSAWSAVTGNPESFRFFGASLDYRDDVYGGTLSGDAGTDTMYAAVNDVSDPIDFHNALHIHGVENITLYSGSYFGGANNVDLSDVTGANRITISDMLHEDSVDDFGNSNGGSSADMTFSNLANGTGIRLDSFTSNFAVTLLEDTPDDVLDITLSHFGGGIFTDDIETLHLTVDQPADGSNVGAFLDANDIAHIILSGRAGQINLGMPSSTADITLEDANLNVFIYGNGAGPLTIKLDNSGAGIRVDDAISRLDLDTQGSGGASSVSVANVNTTLVNVTGNQDLNLYVSQTLDASDMTGNLWANAGGFGQSLKGGLGDDQINGSGGNDRLNGGSDGNDFLLGNDGADTFVFDTAPGNPDHNVYLIDFQGGIDHVELKGLLFDLSAGGLSAADFFSGDPGASAGQKIVFDQHSGTLYYDSNGVTVGGAEVIATVLGGSTVTYNDINVV